MSLRAIGIIAYFMLVGGFTYLMMRYTDDE